MEEGKDDFYRPKAEARQSNYSVEQLERRLHLAQSIGAELKFIRTEIAGLSELAEKIERVGAALRELEHGAKGDTA